MGPDDLRKLSPRQSARVERLLSKFPGPLVLRATRAIFQIFVGSVLFSSFGYWMILHDIPLGHFEFYFFVFCTVAAALLLLPGLASLTLDREGFTVRWVWQRRTMWSEADRFRVVPISRKLYRIYYVDGGLSAKWKISKWMSMRGGNATIPDDFGLSVDELDTLMVRWRAKALSADQSAQGH